MAIAILFFLFRLLVFSYRPVEGQFLDKQIVADTIRINCGGVRYVDIFNRTWEEDVYFQGGENRTVANASLIADLVSSSFNNSALFESFRTWPTGDNNSYVIPVTGSGLYWIRLFFAEMELANPSRRQFTLAINDVLVRKSFFVPDGPYIAEYLEYSFPTNATNITITFVRETGNPYISAIEIAPAPDGQLRETFTAAQGPVVLATWYHINLGVESFSIDSYGRQWNYIETTSFRNPDVTQISTNASIVGANVSTGYYSEWIYQTSTKVSAVNYTDVGLAVQFLVSTVGTYLFVAHFAEIEYTNVGDRIVDIYVNNAPVVTGLDVVAKVGPNEAYNFTFTAVSTAVTSGISFSILANSQSKYKEPMLNAVEVFFIDYLNPQLTPSPPSSGQLSGAVIAAIVCAGVVGLLAVLGLVLVCLWRRKLARKYALDKRPGGAELLRALQERAVRFITLRDVTRATGNWNSANKLGEGGFGTVYRGEAPNGGDWAIKRAKKASQATLDEFTNEVDLISQLNHVNLVRLLGFCTEMGEQIFVYEFCHNGTLRDFVKESSKREPLSFETRLDILLGAARGLQYLHSFAKEPLIHRDIKSENILLSKELQAKVADFGLLKRIETGGQQKTVKIAGTRGYLDPEYYNTFRVTEKSDVYSFGVLMMEVLTGRPPVLDDKANPDNSKTLVAWAKPLIARGAWDALADPRLNGLYSKESFGKVMQLAASAVRPHGHERPAMEGIVRGLDKIVGGNVGITRPPTPLGEFPHLDAVSRDEEKSSDSRNPSVVFGSSDNSRGESYANFSDVLPR